MPRTTKAAIAARTAPAQTTSTKRSSKVSFNNIPSDDDSSGTDMDINDTDYSLSESSAINKNKTNIASGDIISNMINIKGPVVNILHLHSDGSISSIHADMTPKLDLVGKLLRGTATFLGEIGELGSIIIIRKDQSKKLPINKHSLPYPFHLGYEHDSGEISAVRGDIIIVRMNNDAVPVDLSIDEYNKYCDSVRGKTHNHTKKTTKKLAPVTTNKTSSSSDSSSDAPAISRQSAETKKLPGKKVGANKNSPDKTSKKSNAASTNESKPANKRKRQA